MDEAKKRRDTFKKSKTKSIKDDEINLRYGPMPTFPKQTRFARIVIAVSLVIIVYFYSDKKNEKLFASSTDKHSQRSLSLQCSAAYEKELNAFIDCVPRTCGRGVYDEVLTSGEVEVLRGVADRGMSLGAPSGGATILDLHSGALSKGEGFVNIYKLPQVSTVFRNDDFNVYKTVRKKIQHIISNQFGVNAEKLHLASPTFFSKLTSTPAVTIHDEYWHVHIDKETYESFHYTALVYLSDYKKEFDGGRFVFVDADNSTSVVEPSKGRLSVFTSGAENPHHVERVTRGERVALTVAFTCDASRSLPDPVLPATKPLT